MRVTPGDITLHCHPSETLIECAWRSGYYWPTICGGVGDCGACRCELVSGEEYVAPLDTVEALMFRINPGMGQAGRPVRLACRMTVSGPVEVFKKGVRLR
ncbi:MAG: ferredoxin [Bradyrhizobium sp.]|nr:ferredoxin [Bradyrhizobium sp.]